MSEASYDLYGRFAQYKNKPRKRKTKPSGSLIYVYGNSTEIVQENKPFALLQVLKRKLSREFNYQNGELKIIY